MELYLTLLLKVIIMFVIFGLGLRFLELLTPQRVFVTHFEFTESQLSSQSRQTLLYHLIIHFDPYFHLVDFLLSHLQSLFFMGLIFLDLCQYLYRICIRDGSFVFQLLFSFRERLILPSPLILLLIFKKI